MAVFFSGSLDVADIATAATGCRSCFGISSYADRVHEWVLLGSIAPPVPRSDVKGRLVCCILRRAALCAR